MSDTFGEKLGRVYTTCKFTIPQHPRDIEVIRYFAWAATFQGYKYWQDYYAGRKTVLTPEDMQYISALYRFHKRRSGT